jgi:quaternary ammonium compound-resistance protein SugE
VVRSVALFLLAGLLEIGGGYLVWPRWGDSQTGRRRPRTFRLEATHPDPEGSVLAMAWAQLLVAGLLEVAWAIGLKYTEGFTRLLPSVATIAAMAGSFVLLAQALRVLPVGTAYAVWTGIGAAGTAVLGILLFDESQAPLRLACLGLIVAGIVGLRLSTN